MKIKFYVTGKAMCINVAYNNKRVRLGMGITLNPAEFDTEKQAVKKTVPTYAEINRQLAKARVFLNEFYHSYLNANNNTPPPPVVLVNAFNTDFLNKAARNAEPEPEIKTVNFLIFAELYLKNANFTKTRKGLFNRTLQLVKDYFTANTINPEFGAISLQVCEGFKTYLFRVKKYNPNTVGTRVKVFKQLMHAATESGYNTNMQYRSSKFTAPTNAADSVYLTETELQTLLNLNLTGKPYLNNARNLFLIGCYSGLRFSDFSQLKPENITNIDGMEFISITQRKTKGKVQIPLHPIVKKLLSANDGNPPRPIANQNLNAYLKELCKIAGITENVRVTKYAAEMQTEHTYKKWQLVTTHTARRSFATNAYLSGLPIDLISAILGHSSIQQTQTYLKLDAHEKAKQAAKHAFFNPANMQIAK